MFLARTRKPSLPCYARSVMRAIRLPLLCAFAGGCLSNALLFFLWRSPDTAGSLAIKQHRSHPVVALAAAAPAAPDLPPNEPGAANVAEDGAHVTAEPAHPAAPPTSDNTEAPPPAGSAVSDVLTSLEAAYRERVSERAPAPPTQTAEAATPTAAANTVAAPEPARSAAPPPAVDVPLPPAPRALDARATAPAPMAPSTPAAPAAVVPPMAAVAPQAPPAPAFAAEDAPPPAQIHYGDINQNTYITNIRQGDVYLIQLQQLAVLQYMQMLGASANAAPASRHTRGAPPSRAFPSGIINPDNPWGFHFTPPNLVR